MKLEKKQGNKLSYTTFLKQDWLVLFKLPHDSADCKESVWHQVRVVIYSANCKMDVGVAGVKMGWLHYNEK